MKTIIGVVVTLALGVAIAFGEPPAAERRAAPEPEVSKVEPAAAPAPEVSEDEKYNRPIENRDWRSAIHAVSQVRDAAVAVSCTLGFLFSALMLGALLLFTAGIAPSATARASVATRDHPLRSFFVGLVTLVVGGLLTAVTKGLVGIFLLPIFTAALLIGLAGVSEQLGRNLHHLSGKEGHRVSHLLAGWSVFSFVSIVPFIGWFGFFPYYAAVGVGSFFSTMFGAKRETPREEYRGIGA